MQINLGTLYKHNVDIDMITIYIVVQGFLLYNIISCCQSFRIPLRSDIHNKYIDVFIDIMVYRLCTSHKNRFKY